MMVGGVSYHICEPLMICGQLHIASQEIDPESADSVGILKGLLP